MEIVKPELRFKINVESFITFTERVLEDAKKLGYGDRCGDSIRKKVAILSDEPGKFDETKCIDETMIMTANLFLGILPEVTMINKFISYSYVYWRKIHERDLKYLIVVIDNFFEQTPLKLKGVFDYFINGHYIDAKCINILWDYVFSFIMISLDFLRNNPKYCPADLDLKSELTRWRVK